MTDSTKTILYPSAALLALVLGTLLFGWWCGLTAVWSLAILGVVVGLAVVVAVPQVIHDELRERRFRSIMLTRSCPKCGHPYDAADINRIEAVIVSTGRSGLGRYITCSACGTKTPWTDRGERWRVSASDAPESQGRPGRGDSY